MHLSGWKLDKVCSLQARIQALVSQIDKGPSFWKASADSFGAGTVFRFTGSSILAKAHNNSCWQLTARVRLASFAEKHHLSYLRGLAWADTWKLVPCQSPNNSAENFAACGFRGRMGDSLSGGSKPIKFAQRTLTKDEALADKSGHENSRTGELREFGDLGEVVNWEGRSERHVLRRQAEAVLLASCGVPLLVHELSR